MSTIWTLTVDDDGTIATTVHPSEAAGLAALRTNYDPTGQCADLDDADMMQSLIDTQGLVIYLSEHDVPVPAPAAPTMVRVTTREVLEGGNDFELAELEDLAKTTLAAAGSLDALLEAALEHDDYLSERIRKYDETTDYDRTVRFLRDDEE